MAYQIKRVAVLGSGAMGGGIAAHLANSGLQVDLLDIAPGLLTPEESAKGLSLTSPAVRNRIVNAGLERVKAAKPAHLTSPASLERIRLGNFEDHFDRVAEADWVIEVVVEKLVVKQQVMAQVDATRKARSIVSSNTSGIPIHEIGAGRSADFQAHFLGTHFFNPPRYLKLVEVTPTLDTSPETVTFLKGFIEDVLGKGVVICKDRPNFIANRIGTFAGNQTIQFILANGYKVSEVDAIAGPLVGNPKSAYFRLQDVVGLDIATDVTRNLYDAVPDDEAREVFKVVPIFQTLLDRGWIGDKKGQGFYKRVPGADGKPEFWEIDLVTAEYLPPQKPNLPLVKQLSKVEPLEERLRRLAAAGEDDRASRFFLHTTLPTLAYASRRVPEIADDIVSLDNAMRWGFNAQLGPFEIWDVLGVQETVQRMAAMDIPVAPWVHEMLATGHHSFYQRQDGQAVAYYDLASKAYKAIAPNPKKLALNALRAQGAELQRNESASLLDLGDGVLCLEYHSKMNSLDDGIFAMTWAGLETLEQDRWLGMVIGNQGEHYCAGANVALAMMNALAGQFDELGEAIRSSQNMMAACRYSRKPVVTAPFSMAIGGGCESAMQSARTVAAMETYMGQVELGVGLIPGSGGCKEMVRRLVSPHIQPHVEPLPYLERVFELIALAKVSTSAAEAREMGFLRDSDRIVMNPDHLLAEAKRTVLELAAAGYIPPERSKIFAAGRRTLAALHSGIQGMVWGRYISEYDAHLARKLAYVLCGGDLSQPQWVPEQVFLDLERETFLSLLGEPKTMERIGAFLQTGKPLRN